MADPALPPSRFGVGYTAGGPVTPGAAVPVAIPNGMSSAATYPPVAVQPSHLMASVAFVLAVFCGLFAVPLTIPLAVVARGQARRRGDSNSGAADAALAVSLIYLVVGVVVLALCVFTG